MRSPGLLLAALLLAGPGTARAEETSRDDILNAVLWMQRAVEYKANALGAFALARIRLDEALADKTWTAAPAEQTGSFGDLPPAVVLDLDETLLDNSGYQAWLVTAGRSFEQKTWTAYVKSETTGAVPGAVEFAKAADAKGVKVFYISNRLAEEEEAPTRALMQRLGFPMGGNVDTMLTTRKRPDWSSSAKGLRRAYVAKDYRILLNLGDNLGDFTDDYRGDAAGRLRLFEANRERWGRSWIMLANPAYGSFESATFGHDFKTSPEAQRQAKRKDLEPWKGP